MRRITLFAVISFFIISAVMVLAGCSYDKANLLVPACDTSFDATFSAIVAPVIQNNCAGCHNNANRKGDISLEGYDNIKQVATSGKLLGTIRHAPGFSPMPVGGNKLDNCTILSIQRWIENGLPNN
jgi:hypothetical protein